MIIDNYLSEDAENYINMEDHIVNQVIGDYERSCLGGNQQQEFDYSLFDDSTRNVSFINNDDFENRLRKAF